MSCGLATTSDSKRCTRQQGDLRSAVAAGSETRAEREIKRTEMNNG